MCDPLPTSAYVGHHFDNLIRKMISHVRLVRTRTHSYTLVRTRTHWYALVYIGTHSYTLVRTRTHWCATQSIFHVQLKAFSYIVLEKSNHVIRHSRPTRWVVFVVAADV